MFITLLQFKVLTAFYENPLEHNYLEDGLYNVHTECAQANLFADKSV
jgi:hypothetical protein